MELVTRLDAQKPFLIISGETVGLARAKRSKIRNLTKEGGMPEAASAPLKMQAGDFGGWRLSCVHSKSGLMKTVPRGPSGPNNGKRTVTIRVSIISASLRSTLRHYKKRVLTNSEPNGPLKIRGS